MTLILELPDKKEAALMARARAQGVSVEQYVERMLDHDLEESPPQAATKSDLVSFFRQSPFVGLELEFERDKDIGRDFSL